VIACRAVAGPTTEDDTVTTRTEASPHSGSCDREPALPVEQLASRPRAAEPALRGMVQPRRFQGIRIVGASRTKQVGVRTRTPAPCPPRDDREAARFVAFVW
jgi:hypothetical protein